ncbi:VOC family protein [Candidatus Nephthysia bennettiae]|uniref:VOC family protein n=1 Tax=Candidatus Nephthysia bennettiae TaxID=3127016 RepID=UPI0030C6A496
MPVALQGGGARRPPVPSAISRQPSAGATAEGDTAAAAGYHAVVLSSALPTAFVPTTDLARARLFFEDTLGLDLLAEDQFALVFDLAGTMLRVTRVDQLRPQPFTVLGWRVIEVAAAVRELTDRGVRFELFPGLDQDASGIWRSPAGARVAWFKDRTATCSRCRSILRADRLGAGRHSAWLGARPLREPPGAPPGPATQAGVCSLAC